MVFRVIQKLMLEGIFTSENTKLYKKNSGLSLTVDFTPETNNNYLKD